MMALIPYEIEAMKRVVRNKLELFAPSAMPNEQDRILNHETSVKLSTQNINQLITELKVKKFL